MRLYLDVTKFTDAVVNRLSTDSRLVELFCFLEVQNMYFYVGMEDLLDKYV